MASVSTLQAAERPRAYVSVNGPDAASYLNRMVSNEVEDMPIGDARDALLLTPKARIIAPLFGLPRRPSRIMKTRASVRAPRMPAKAMAMTIFIHTDYRHRPAAAPGRGR